MEDTPFDLLKEESQIRGGIMKNRGKWGSGGAIRQRPNGKQINVAQSSVCFLNLRCTVHEYILIIYPGGYTLQHILGYQCKVREREREREREGNNPNCLLSRSDLII